MPPKISIHELYSLKKQKDSIKNQSFDKILEMCHNKIRKIATAGGMNTFFEVPYMVIGLPLYNITACINYVVECLKNNGLLVQILPYPNDNILYISWNPFDVSIKNKKCIEMNEKSNRLF